MEAEWRWKSSLLCGRGDSSWGDVFSLGETEAVQWLGCAPPGMGHKEQSPPARLADEHGGFPQQCQGMLLLCLLLFCQEPNDAFSPHLPVYVLADPLQSILLPLLHPLSRLPQALFKSCKADQARCIPAHHSASVEPLMGSWGWREGASRVGEGATLPFLWEH